MDGYFNMLDDKAAVVTAQKTTDSLGCYKFQKVNREEYYLMQSPEGFDFPLLRDSFDCESTLTEVTQQLLEDSEIELYFDFNNNIKLTDTDGNKKENYDSLISQLSALTTKEKLEAACFVDMVFRLHNSLFENENYVLTDKWLNALGSIK